MFSLWYQHPYTHWGPPSRPSVFQTRDIPDRREESETSWGRSSDWERHNGQRPCTNVCQMPPIRCSNAIHYKTRRAVLQQQIIISTNNNNKNSRMTIICQFSKTSAVKWHSSGCLNELMLGTGANAEKQMSSPSWLLPKILLQLGGVGSDGAIGDGLPRSQSWGGSVQGMWYSNFPLFGLTICVKLPYTP